MTMPLPRRADEDAVALFTPAQAAEILNVSESWIRREAAARRIPCTRLGRALRFTRHQLDTIIAGAEQPILHTPLTGLTRRSRRAG